MHRRRFVLILTALAGLISLLPVDALRASETLPARLTDQEFWSMVLDFSEPNGYFRSDNLLSNEWYFQSVIPELTRVAARGRAYLGVGPEQNFTYMAAVKPAMAFIIDIRRGNRDLHLMYKALFELSADRAEFVSRLFARKRPVSLSSKSTVLEIFDALMTESVSDALHSENKKAIREELLRKHGLPLSPEEVAGIDAVYEAFVTYGPAINYSSTGGGGFRGMPSYQDLMVATDGDGQSRGYLSTEDSFAVVKDLENRNLVVPIVGDFAGPKAIRSVGQYLKGRGGLVSAFYLSNVEQFLHQDGTWGRFCTSVATLPLDESSRFIRSARGLPAGQGILGSALGSMALETRMCD
jgi:hypothetical protein